MSAIPDRLGLLSRSDADTALQANRPHWRGRRLPSANKLARRRILVVWLKRLLPVGALALLSLVVLWPEIGNRHNPARISYHIAPGTEASSQGSMTKAHYQGLDDSGRPFTLTADQAVQHDAERVSLVRYSNWEVVCALSLAGIVNAAMVMMAARAFHAGHSGVAEIEVAYRTLIPLFGGAAAGVFLISLMASGISSSVVGTMAGQVIMQGFVEWRIPVWVRRAVTMVPAFVVVALGWNATRSLVLSQVVLSLVLPVPMVALLLLTRRRDVMGVFRSGRWVMAGAWVALGVIVVLNAVLLGDLAGVV